MKWRFDIITISTIIKDHFLFSFRFIVQLIFIFITDITWMKSKTRDTFLTAPARRMHACRMRQQQHDPEAHRDRVNTQRKEHRLRTRTNVLSEEQTTKKHQSILKTREFNKKRQHRYRSRQSNDKKALRREKDRNYRLLKRKTESQCETMANKEIQSSYHDATSKSIPKLSSIAPFFYSVSLKFDS